jgi:hypothetical protein
VRPSGVYVAGERASGAGVAAPGEDGGAVQCARSVGRRPGVVRTRARGSLVQRGGGDGAWAARLPGGAEGRRGRRLGGAAPWREHVAGVATSGGRPRRAWSGQRTAPARQQPLAARRTAGVGTGGAVGGRRLGERGVGEGRPAAAAGGRGPLAAAQGRGGPWRLAGNRELT